MNEEIEINLQDRIVSVKDINRSRSANYSEDKNMTKNNTNFKFNKLKNKKTFIDTNADNKINDLKSIFKINKRPLSALKKSNIRYKSAENFYKNNIINNKLNNNFLSSNDDTNKLSYEVTDKSLLYELRNTFQKSLAKLNNNDTKDIAYKELVNIILKFNNSKSLRIFISSLSISPNNCTIGAKECQVMIIGVLAKVYQENLLDPLDNPPSIYKTIDRLIKIIHKYMKENSDTVHIACSESIVQLYKNCMPKDNTYEIMKLFFDYSVKFIEGGINLVIQKASALSLSTLILFLRQENEYLLLEFITPSILKLFLNTNFDSSNIFDCILYLIEFKDNNNSKNEKSNCNIDNFHYFSEKLKEIYEKLIKSMGNAKTLDNSRLSCCKIFYALGYKLIEYNNNNNQPLGFYICDVLQAIKNATKDRLYRIQVAARLAYKVWLKLEKINIELQVKKTNLIINKDKDENYEDYKNRVIKNALNDNNNINNLSYNNNNNNELTKQNINTVLNYSNYNRLNVLRNISKLNKDLRLDSKNNKIKSKNIEIYKSSYKDLLNNSLIDRQLQSNNMYNITHNNKNNIFDKNNSENLNNDCINTDDYNLKYGIIHSKDKIIPSESYKKNFNYNIELKTNNNSLFPNIGTTSKQNKQYDKESNVKSINQKKYKCNITDINNESINKVLNDSLETNKKKSKNNIINNQENNKKSKNDNLSIHSKKFNERRKSIKELSNIKFNNKLNNNMDLNQEKIQKTKNINFIKDEIHKIVNLQSSKQKQILSNLDLRLSNLNSRLNKINKNVIYKLKNNNNYIADLNKYNNMYKEKISCLNAELLEIKKDKLIDVNQYNKYNNNSIICSPSFRMKQEKGICIIY